MNTITANTLIHKPMKNIIDIPVLLHAPFYLTVYTKLIGKFINLFLLIVRK